MELSKGVILVSGGLDSTTLMYLFVKQNVDFVPLFINYGQHCAEHELETLKQVIPVQYANKIELIDERFSTVEAHRTLSELNVSHNQRKEAVDTYAACEILDTYIRRKGK